MFEDPSKYGSFLNSSAVLKLTVQPAAVNQLVLVNSNQLDNCIAG